MNMRILRTAALLALSLSAAVLDPAHAFPERPVKLILPYTAGSPNDVMARLVAPYLTARLGQAVVIDNRPGGGTTIGVKAVLAVDPDGYTLLYSNTPTHLIAPLVNKGAGYDAIKDFVPIAMVGRSANVVVIAPSLPVTTLAEFIAYAKVNPEKLNFGFGQGTQPQLVGELFKRAAGLRITNVPYRGGAQAVTDLLGGQIHMNIGTVSTLLPLIRERRLRAIAVTGLSRSADLPDVPTFAESGLSEVTSVTTYGILGPASTPAAVVERVNRAVNESLELPEVRLGLEKLGFEPKGGSPQDFAAVLYADMQKWPPIVQATGFVMQ
jgi:tripartite-type tricarboxylate transporter receptor subunit TctC